MAKASLGMQDQVRAQLNSGNGDASTMKRPASPLVWVLLGNRPGDNNQLLALADDLEWPYEAKRLTYNRLRHVAALRGQRLLYLTKEARRSLAPPWPDLVMALGYDTMPVA